MASPSPRLCTHCATQLVGVPRRACIVHVRETRAYNVIKPTRSALYADAQWAFRQRRGLRAPESERTTAR